MSGAERALLKSVAKAVSLMVGAVQMGGRYHQQMIEEALTGLERAEEQNRKFHKMQMKLHDMGI